MAIISYLPTNHEEALVEYIQKDRSVFSYRNTLYALGDYWIDYFKNTEVLKLLLANNVTLMSLPYMQIINNVFYTTLTDTPLADKFMYSMFVFQKSKLIYDEKLQCYKCKYSDIEVHNSVSGRVDNIIGVDYLANGLIEPTVTLENNTHFKFNYDTREVFLYVDLFGDPNISDQTYREALANSEEYLILWGANITFKEITLYERFGRFLWDQEFNSESYKNLLSILQFFFVNAKTVHSFETVINTLFGVPTAKYNGEVVVSIDTEYNASEEPLKYTVTTDRAIYTVPGLAELQVKEGDVLKKFQIFGIFLHVYDWKTEWYKFSNFPWDLCESTSITQYLYNGVHICDGSIRCGYPAHLKSIKPEPGRNILTIDNILEEDNILYTLIGDYYGTDDEFYLYNLMDTILKYNVLRIEANINGYLPIDSKNVKNIYKIVREGTPVYLYPFIEITYNNDFVEGDIPEETGDTLLYSPDVVATVTTHAFAYYGKEDRETLLSMYNWVYEDGVYRTDAPDADYTHTTDEQYIINLLDDDNKSILHCAYPLPEDRVGDGSMLLPGMSLKHPRVLRFDARTRMRGEHVSSHHIFR